MWFCVEKDKVGERGSDGNDMGTCLSVCPTDWLVDWLSDCLLLLLFYRPFSVQLSDKPEESLWTANDGKSDHIYIRP